MFYVIPAIDLRGGKCVRLMQGRFEEETVYSDDPIAIAKRWESEGAEWIHVVDLDGAREGKLVNLESVLAIRESVSCKVQVGGGIRTEEAVDNLIRHHGIDRVVLGTAAIENAQWAGQIVAEYGERIAIALDVVGGKIAVRGWGVTKEFEAITYAQWLAEQGVRCFVYTDIARDGTMAGPNLEGAVRLAEATGVSVIVSAGISGLEQVKAAAQLSNKGVCGCIIGKALYEGRLLLSEAISIAQQTIGEGRTPVNRDCVRSEPRSEVE